MKKNKLTISSSPHILSDYNVSKIMWNVALALLPAVGVSIWLFRIRAVLLISVCVITTMITEWVFLKLRKGIPTLSDGSAFLSGLLLALILPPSTPLGLAALGAVVSIVIGKQVYGGLGHNVFNPALVGRAFMMAAFPVVMTSWIKPFSLDAVTTATPLGLMKFSNQATSLYKLFLGTIPGCLGETSALAIIIGGIYLIVRGYIDWRIPVGILSTVFITSTILYLINPNFGFPLLHLLSGGLMIGVFFMATDPVSSPFTPKGKWIFSVGIGTILMVIRIWSGLPEGMMYSILLMNAATPLINRITKPKRFGI